MTILDDLNSFSAVGLNETDEIAALTSLLDCVRATDLSALADRVLNNKATFESTRRFAYRHVNGFSKITLVKTDSLCLRVHVWDSVEVAAENIHSHKWAFASRVVVGSIGELRFSIPNDMSPTAMEFSYVPRLDSLPGELVSQREVHLERSENLTHEESSIYSVSTTEIHQVRVRQVQGDLISLVLTGNSRTKNAKVYAQLGAVPVSDRVDAALSGQDVEQTLLKIRALSS